MAETDYASLQEWIQSESVPFSLASNESLNNAVDRIVEPLAGIEILGLGEPTHGVEAFLILRNRIFQRLVEEHGYSAIAIESSFPRGTIADDYINGSGADPEVVLKTGFSHGFGKSPANRELIEWVRAYNASKKHSPKLTFYGFDAPTEMMNSDSPRRQLQFVLDYLEKIDGASVQERRQRIESLLGDDAPWENMEANYEPAKSVGLSDNAIALRHEAAELIKLFESRYEEFTDKTDVRAFILAQLHAIGAQKLLEYHAAVATPSENRLAALLGLRDQMMATNLEYISQRERGRGKVFVHAHNSHLQRGKAVWQWGPNLLEWWAAGSHVAALFEERYFIIGAGVGTADSLSLTAPEPGTIEQLMCAAPGPVRFVPTHYGERLPHEQMAHLPVRQNKDPRYFPFTHDSLRQFDALVVLDNAEMK